MSLPCWFHVNFYFAFTNMCAPNTAVTGDILLLLLFLWTATYSNCLRILGVERQFRIWMLCEYFQSVVSTHKFFEKKEIFSYCYMQRQHQWFEEIIYASRCEILAASCCRLHAQFIQFCTIFCFAFALRSTQNYMQDKLSWFSCSPLTHSDRFGCSFACGLNSSSIVMLMHNKYVIIIIHLCTEIFLIFLLIISVCVFYFCISDIVDAESQHRFSNRTPAENGIR